MKKLNRKIEKRTASVLLAVLLVFTLSACKGKENAVSSDGEISKDSAETAAVDGNNGGKILVAYFAVAENSEVEAVSSASIVSEEDPRGRMQALAEMIQTKTGGDLFSVQTSVAYPGDIGDLIDYASQEQEENARPELTSHIEDFDQYDTVFVGFPTWWYDMPQVLYSFFDEYDFSGKTIVPFNSHNGSRFSGTIDTIIELEPDAEVIEDGFTVNERDVADAADDIADWLREIGY